MSIRKAMKNNVVLIGMPGCGKSSVGRALAAMLGAAFRDTDELVTELAGCSIPDIFADRGEAAFRELEHEALLQLLSGGGLVIATGGGIVKREDNRALLRERARVIWLRRELDRLPREGRPLSLNADLYAMYRERAPLYAQCADIIADNTGTIEEAAEECRRQL